MDRLVRRNVLALSGRAVEASGDVDVLLLDKTGTITLGNRQAAEFVPMPGVEEVELAEGRPAGVARRRDPRGPLDRRARQALRHPRAPPRRAPVRAVHRPDADERHRLRQHAPAQGRGRFDRPLRRGGGRPGAGRARSGARAHQPRGRDAAGRRPRRAGPGRRLPQGHRQGRDARPLRAAAGDGHPDGHGHGRQPPDPRRRSPRRRASTTSSPRPRRSASSS